MPFVMTTGEEKYVSHLHNAYNQDRERAYYQDIVDHALLTVHQDVALQLSVFSSYSASKVAVPDRA